MTALALESVAFEYGGTPVLSGLDLSIADGEIVVLLGPSGSGKSTILRLLLGLAAPARGRIAIGGREVSTPRAIIVPPEERELAVVFQDLALWPHLSVRGNLAFGLDARGVAPKLRDERIDAMLARLGLADKAQRRPGELSGGERQRAAIARALVLEPRAVLLDEPLANLDAPLKRQLLALFRGVFDERDTTVLYVTHDVREAAVLADRIAVLDRGRVVQHGSLAELKARPSSDFVRALFDDLGVPARSSSE